MAGKQSDLHDILLGIVSHAYFQPPENIRMQYPCIRYKLEGGKSTYADNKKYLYTKKYTATLIHSDPDPAEFNSLIELPYCEFDRHYAKEGLNHFVFSIYY